eukprot:GHVS01090663.1.p1 GENE.GHVS01090663.1~~GHVS01090663.1.p1  ORF type:complete len:766 (+),score=169.55 GHVS01090663.1:297-2594(+)
MKLLRCSWLLLLSLLLSSYVFAQEGSREDLEEAAGSGRSDEEASFGLEGLFEEEEEELAPAGDGAADVGEVDRDDLLEPSMEDPAFLEEDVDVFVDESAEIFDSAVEADVAAAETPEFVHAPEGSADVEDFSFLDEVPLDEAAESFGDADGEDVDASFVDEPEVVEQEDVEAVAADEAGLTPVFDNIVDIVDTREGGEDEVAETAVVDDAPPRVGEETEGSLNEGEILEDGVAAVDMNSVMGELSGDIEEMDKSVDELASLGGDLDLATDEPAALGVDSLALEERIVVDEAGAPTGDSLLADGPADAVEEVELRVDEVAPLEDRAMDEALETSPLIDDTGSPLEESADGLADETPVGIEDDVVGIEDEPAPAELDSVDELARAEVAPRRDTVDLLQETPLGDIESSRIDVGEEVVDTVELPSVAFGDVNDALLVTDELVGLLEEDADSQLFVEEPLSTVDAVLGDDFDILSGDAIVDAVPEAADEKAGDGIGLSFVNPLDTEKMEASAPAAPENFDGVVSLRQEPLDGDRFLPLDDVARSPATAERVELVGMEEEATISDAPVEIASGSLEGNVVDDATSAIVVPDVSAEQPRENLLAESVRNGLQAAEAARKKAEVMTVEALEAAERGSSQLAEEAGEAVERKTAEQMEKQLDNVKRTVTDGFQNLDFFGESFLATGKKRIEVIAAVEEDKKVQNDEDFQVHASSEDKSVEVTDDGHDGHNHEEHSHEGIEGISELARINTSSAASVSPHILTLLAVAISVFLL